MGRYHDFFSQTDVKLWLYDMTRGASSTLFVTGLWYAWCWRNNNIFEDQHWRIHEVVRKTFALHDECVTYYPKLGVDSHSSRLLFHWSPPPEGTLKLNVDGSFLEDSLRLGAGGVVRNHEGDWVAGFSHYEVGGDALLAELRAIQLGLEFCRNKGYNNIVCESDCLEAVELVNVGRNNTLHIYATEIFHIIALLHEIDSTVLVHVLREQNICADFLAKEGSHSKCSTHWSCPPPGLESRIMRDKLGI